MDAIMIFTAVFKFLTGCEIFFIKSIDPVYTA
ncbi:hypothetical protein IIE_05685 [Bacillus cereus VD045]|nr:hypothetical protein IIE_05685 [Bacillus cereus VD045]